MMGGGIEITGYTGPGADITIPDFIDGSPVLSIGYQAFYGNNNLTSVTISTFVTSIGEQAFYGSSLVSVWIGPYVSSIGRLAFQNCQTLLIIDLDPQNSTYSSANDSLSNS